MGLWRVFAAKCGEAYLSQSLVITYVSEDRAMTVLQGTINWLEMPRLFILTTGSLGHAGCSNIVESKGLSR